jgi:hypothetical protein
VSDETTGKDLARQFDEVPPDAQAALLLHLLETNSAGMDEVLQRRHWTGGNSSKTGHGSGFPITSDDHDG